MKQYGTVICIITISSTGWESNEYELRSGPEYFTEPYTGWYIVYVNLYADWDYDGVYDYVNYFIIDEIVLEEP